MTPEQFCYWLQGWVEIQKPKAITPEQLQEIKNHLALVFEKKTPDTTSIDMAILGRSSVEHIVAC